MRGDKSELRGKSGKLQKIVKNVNRKVYNFQRFSKQEPEIWKKYRKSVDLEGSKRSHGSLDLRGFPVIKDLKSQIGFSSFLQYSVQTNVNFFGPMNAFGGFGCVLEPDALWLSWSLALGFVGGTMTLTRSGVKETRPRIDDFGLTIDPWQLTLALKAGFGESGESTGSRHGCVGIDHWNGQNDEIDKIVENEKNE